MANIYLAILTRRRFDHRVWSGGLSSTYNPVAQLMVQMARGQIAETARRRAFSRRSESVLTTPTIIVRVDGWHRLSWDSEGGACGLVPASSASAQPTARWSPLTPDTDPSVAGTSDLFLERSGG